MRKIGLVVAAILLAAGLTGFADCGCATDAQETCYTVFRANEIIQFSLVVPVDYYWCHDTTATPLITGWWVEVEDGPIVKHVEFSEPRGHWETFTWDLTDDTGNYVAPGSYRIVVSTTSTDDVEAHVKILSCCCSPCFFCCQPSPCICRTPSHCPVPYGEAYLSLKSGGTRNCCTFSVQLYFESP